MTDPRAIEQRVQYRTLEGRSDGVTAKVSDELREQGRELELFREQAIQARGPSRLPGVIVVHAPYTNITALLSILVVFAVVLFCIFGRLTQLVTVQGVLIPEGNSLKIYSPKAGVLVRSFVSEGDAVKAGSPLFAVSAEQYGADSSAILAHETELMRQRLAAIAENKKLAMSSSETLQASLRQEITIALSQKQILTDSIEVERKAVALDQAIVDRKLSLLNQGIGTLDQKEAAQELLSTDRRSLLSLMDSEQSTIATLARDQYELDDSPLQLATKLANLDEQSKSTEVDLAKTEMQRETVVVAPVDSIVSSDVAYTGQNVSLDNPLVVLRPQNSKLIAQLLVPSQGIGFIQKGSAVAIKYDAFPYQTFGYFKGKVLSIGSVALARDELQTLKVPVNSSQPYFNVLASIDLQTVGTYGRQTPLAAGSTFSADVAGETRYIWQWILNPLLSIKGGALGGEMSGGK